MAVELRERFLEVRLLLLDLVLSLVAETAAVSAAVPTESCLAPLELVFRFESAGRASSRLPPLASLEPAFCVLSSFVVDIIITSRSPDQPWLTCGGW